MMTKTAQGEAMGWLTIAAAATLIIFKSPPDALDAATVQGGPNYACPIGFHGAGLMNVMGTQFVVSGYGARLSTLPYLPAFPGIPRAKYNFPQGWHYTPVGVSPRYRVKAVTWDARCYCVVMGDICVGPLEGDQWYDFTIEPAFGEEQLTLCSDGNYVDDASGCPTGGDGGGPSHPPPNATGSGTGLPPTNPPTEEYYICFFTFWSDGSWEAYCYGPYAY
jgi:hypothetical protein